jgi:hypothetical protein
MNLRNNIYHGIQTETSEIEASLIVHSILHLALLRINNPTQKKDESKTNDSNKDCGDT